MSTKRPVDLFSINNSIMRYAPTTKKAKNESASNFVSNGIALIAKPRITIYAA
jgi:ABC-type molybdate transport system substrate-binding protein